MSDSRYNDIVLSSAFPAFLTTTAQALLPDILKAHGYKNEELLYCVAQLARAVILWQFNNSATRIAATPFLLHYFYTMTKDDRRYSEDETDPDAEAFANCLTVAVFAGYDIVTNQCGWLEAVSTTLVSVATSLTTKSSTRGIYQLTRDGLFAMIPQKISQTNAEKNASVPASPNHSHS